MRTRHGSARCIASARVAALHAAALHLGLIIAVANDASAQSRDSRLSVATSLTASGGSATDQRGVRSNAATLAPSIVLSRAGRFDLTIGGALTRFETGAQSVGVLTGFALTQGVSPWARLSLNNVASTTRTSFGSQFESAEAVPAAELRAGRFTVFAGARGAIGATTFNVERAGTPASPTLPLGSPRTPPAVPTTLRRERFVRGGLAPLAGAQATFTNSMQTRTVIASYRVESMQIDRARVVDHQAAVSLNASRTRVDASLGQRVATGERRTFAAANVSFAATRALSVDVGGGSYPTNRVNGTLAGTFLQAGATLRAGGVRGSTMTSTATPRGAPRLAPGFTRLAMHAPRAVVVSVAGDWNEWQLQAATRGDNGVWYVDVSLPEGEYRYAFRVDGTWRVPAGAAQADDGFGGKSAFVTVRGERRNQHQPTAEHR